MFKCLRLKVSCADFEKEEQKTGAITKDDSSCYSALLGFCIRASLDRKLNNDIVLTNKETATRFLCYSLTPLDIEPVNN